MPTERPIALAAAAGGDRRGGGRGDGGGRVPPQPKLDNASLTRLGDALRAMYDEGAREPIPVDWLELLQRADSPER